MTELRRRNRFRFGFGFAEIDPKRDETIELFSLKTFFKMEAETFFCFRAEAENSGKMRLPRKVSASEHRTNFFSLLKRTLVGGKMLRSEA